MSKPNIFVYMIDTQRSANMSCHGYRRETTPNIDRIAADGCLFENHFTNSMWSLPSQASFFNGKYLCGHGCGDQYQFMEDDFPTVSEALNSVGYLTAAIQPNPWVQQDSGNLGRGFTEWLNPRDLDEVPPYTKEEAGESFTQAWKNVGLIEKWLEDHESDDRPWLLFALSGEPHMKYWAPEPWRSEFLMPGVSVEEAEVIPQLQFSGTAGEVVLTPEQWAIVRSLRDGATASVDHAIGEIYRNFERRGLLDNTLFIVTSDHGDSHGEHGFHTGHCQVALYDTTLWVPLVMRLPGLFEGGQRVKHLVQTVDFMPTALELAGVEDEDIWSHMHGKSLTQALGEQPIREFALAELQKPLEPFHWVKREHPRVDIRQWNRHLKSARTHEWKYIWASDSRDELYHVAEDPDEQQNLINEQPAVAAELYEKMENLLLSLDRRDYGDCLKLTGHVTVDPDVAARLEAWGLYRRVLGAERKE